MNDSLHCRLTLISAPVGFGKTTLLSDWIRQVKVGFADQPAAQGQHLWNFLGMLLVGLAGGCPTRQLILAGEGDGNATMFVLGMLSGSAATHNFALVKPCVTGSLPVTVFPAGMAAVVFGLVFCLISGFSLREGPC